MDIKQYIGSGILEDYVLGMVSEQERREVQCLSKIYPEIASYLAEIEDELASAALGDSISPPRELRAKILENLPDRVADDAEIASDKVTPVVQMIPDEEQLESSNKSKRKVILPYGIAASLVVIIGLGAMYYSALTQSRLLEEELLAVEMKEALTEKSNAQLRVEKEELAENLNLLKDPTTQKIELKGLPGHEGALAVVYWNTSNDKVLIEATELPEVPEGKQYQLWTLVDGTPVDQGMLPLDGEGLSGMKSANTADAFAITLEPLGGSETPTLEELVVLGEV